MTGRMVALAAPLVFFLACWTSGADRPMSRTGAVRTDDVQDIVFLGDARPVLLRLHIRIDGKPFRTAFQDAWEDYVGRLFRYLDRNGDGVLSEAEAARMPPPLRLTGRVNLAFNFRAIDADGDGRVTLRELKDFYRDFGAQAFHAELPAARARVPVAVEAKLFALLDTNRDGKLSARELEAAPSLMRLDRDRDELVAPEELAPELFPAFAGGEGDSPPAPPARSPFIILEAGSDRASQAARLLEQYGRGATTLTRAASGLPQAVFDRLDANHDGVLDAGELEHFADGVPDLELRFWLGKRQHSQAPLEVLTPRASVVWTKARTLVARLDHVLVEFRCNAGRPRMVADAGQRYLSLFRSAAGARGFLREQDAHRAGFYPGMFRLLDRDGDGKLTEKELVGYLNEINEAQAHAVASMAALRISDEGRGLFSLLDRNRDGRLSLRELRNAAELPALLGVPRQGSVSRRDLPRSYQLALGLTRGSFNAVPGEGEAFSPPGLPLVALEWAPPGLAWFTKMDRNHDGDVSRREFLGTRQHFQRLDADGDGLISFEEAERAAQLFPRTTK